MDQALVVFSRKGLFQNAITARDLKSREHYRKMWPLVTIEEPHRLVTWVRPSFDDDGKLIQRSYFRRYPGKREVDLVEFFDHEERIRRKQSGESEEHQLAKRLIAQELQRRLSSNLAMPWYYRDDSISQYHLEGNLLLGAESITQEQEIKTPLGNSYRLDVAVLGKRILQHPPILGGIEIEFGHAFDGLKALAGRSMGFPLISVDITGMSLDEITPEWAEKALTATTSTSSEGSRKTFVYLNDLLYPLYVKLPPDLTQGDDFRHQFVVFAADEHMERIKKILTEVSSALQLSTPHLQIVNGKSESALKQVANLGNIAGPDWREFNERKCLTITLDRPRSPADVPSHLMHIATATLLASRGNALVGYKDRLGIVNEDPESDVWTAYRRGEWHRTVPKRLAEPFQRYLRVINDLINSG